MNTIAIKLRSERLLNPDADIRYTLPDLLIERCRGIISDGGYDYVGDSNDLVIFLNVSDLKKAMACIDDVFSNILVLGNDLRNGAVVAIERDGKYEVVFPPNSEEDFQL